MKQSDNKTRITIFLKDNSKRVINCLGNYNYTSALELANDLDGKENILRIETQIL